MATKSVAPSGLIATPSEAKPSTGMVRTTMPAIVSITVIVPSLGVAT
jgi:hypothetical protein